MIRFRATCLVLASALSAPAHLGAQTPEQRDADWAPGMVFTVEPWYYNHRLGVSVFVEDVVVVTAEGAEVLTRSLPRSPDELERMVR